MRSVHLGVLAIAAPAARCYATTMHAKTDLTDIRTTAVSVAIGGAGAALAWVMSMPAPVLIGPAVLVSLAGLAGIRTGISPGFRDACFVVLGAGIGAGFSPDAGAAILRWPLAFVALALGLFATIELCSRVLHRGFGFDRRSAVLASAPGHLSFVMGLAADTQADVAKVAVVQSIRLLALTLIVPFAAMAMGVRSISVVSLGSEPMTWTALAILLIVGGLAGFGLRRFRVPAPFLLGGMLASGLTHVTGVFPGSVPNVLMVPAFMILGTLIGTRFSGMSPAQFLSSLLAGAAITTISALIAGLIAVPISVFLAFPLSHVLAAFAPGGLETMIAMGAALGANPGFLAACHIMRLLILTALIPLSLARARTSPR